MLEILPAYGRLLSLKLFCKGAGKGCRTRLHAMVQYAESMVKLVENAVF
jgi:hypothetical protein